MTHAEFAALFPDNAACMDYLRDKFYPAGAPCPSCGKPTKFHRITGRSAYACQYCRHQVYPTAGTIMHKTTTSLRIWFYAIYLMSSTRCGISAKELERETGVSYKTAHRMFKQIRSMLTQDGEEPLSGDVEVDESAHGGKLRQSDRNRGREYTQRKVAARPTIWTAVERGGRARATIIPSRNGAAVEGPLHEYVLPASMIFTDEFPGDSFGVKMRFRGHKRINHSARIYAKDTTHTQTVEGFFSLFKNSVRGAHHSISAKYLQSYLDEYCFRYNHRKDARPIFWSMMDRMLDPAARAAA